MALTSSLLLPPLNFTKSISSWSHLYYLFLSLTLADLKPKGTLWKDHQRNSLEKGALSVCLFCGNGLYLFYEENNNLLYNLWIHQKLSETESIILDMTNSESPGLSDRLSSGHLTQALGTQRAESAKSSSDASSAFSSCLWASSSGISSEQTPIWAQDQASKWSTH